MKTQIKTWGNSQAIRIPKDMLEEDAENASGVKVSLV